MYMGEIVRLAIVDLASQNKLFEGRLSEQMKTSGAFGTSYVSDIERCVCFVIPRYIALLWFLFKYIQAQREFKD